MKLKPFPSARRAERELTSSDAAAAPEAALESDVRGLIDHVTTDRLSGWAWDAGHPGARLRVELHLADEVVASTIADFLRPDLARTGVGDGCHAFEFPLTPAWIEQRADLTAVAFGVDGSATPIPIRPRRTDEASPVAGQMLRAIETMQGEQQGLRTELAALRQRAETLPDAGTVAAMRHAQDDLQRKVEQLELWLTRIDGHLGTAELRTEPPVGGRLDAWQAVLIAVLASASSAALAFAVARHFVQP